MNMQTWEVAEQPGTPRKFPRELDSTDCKRKSRVHVSMSAQKQLAMSKEPARNTRTHNELSSDSDEDLKALSKTIKKLHFEEDTKLRCLNEQRQMVTVRPFEIEEEPAESRDWRDSRVVFDRLLDRLPRKLHLKKESFVEKKEQPPAFRMALYRLNSMMVDQTAQPSEEYLGDNIYIKNILRQMSTNPHEEEHEDPAEDTSRFDQDYQIVEIVGPTGSFKGNCFKVHNKLDRMVYFVKEVMLELNELEQLESITYPILRGQMEIYTADSDNLFVRFYQSWTEGGRLFLVYEPASFTLASCNDEKRRLSERQVRSLLMDVSSSLIWLKDRRNASHLNLKPQNVLNCRGKYKLMDMLCSLENLHKLKSDERYLAPEVCGFYLDEVIDVHRCDIYSLGLVLLENLTGSFSSYSENKASDVKAMRRLLKGSFHYSPSLKRLILRMTSLDPLKRPTASELFGFNDNEPIGKNTQVRRKLSL